MITIKPFRGYRPEKGLENRIASKPYDVLSHNNALEIGNENPFSFVHIIRPEIDMPEDTNPYSNEVYKNAGKALQDFIDRGYLVEEEKKVLYIYRQIMNGREQNGIVGCIAIDDYGEGRIKRHEFTRVDKEKDRINHFYAAQANTEPVFLFYKKKGELNRFIENWTSNNQPVYNFTSEDGVKQILWVVDDGNSIQNIQKVFKDIDSLYIADGHHRTASSYKVGLTMREENTDYTGEEEFNYFLSVIFPGDELYIMPYNRIVKDLNGNSEEQFLEKVSKGFDIEPLKFLTQPMKKHEIAVAFKDKAYKIIPKKDIFNNADEIDCLDASILQNNILAPILGIEDPRVDNRIEFYGGEGMIGTIINRLNDDMQVAFLLYPTQIEEITAVSDINKVMPPKSTWFEPKLMSGLFVHKF